MPRPPVSVQRALVDGGLPEGFTVAALRWLVQRHAELAQRSPSNRERWHGRWAYTCHDLLVTIYAQPMQAPGPPAPPGGR